MVVTDAMLTATNVIEADYDEFVMGDTYTEGELVMVTTGVEVLTLDIAPTPAAWAVGATITGSVGGKTAVIISQLAALTYEIRERSGDFTLGEILTDGTNAGDQGAAYPTVADTLDGEHKVYESLSAGNIGNYPPTDVDADTPKWLLISATNRWACFDASVGSQTSKAESITYTITPGETFDSIAFLNLKAQEIQVMLTDPTDGVIFDETIDLLDVIITGTVPEMDWYAYFFSTISMTTDIALPGITLYLNTVVDITITFALGTAKVGGIIFGTQMTLGNTLYSPSVGIRDYSIKSTDSFGNPVITQRAFAKRMSVDLTVPTNSISYVQNVLASFRTALLLWIGVDEYSSTIIYGFYKDFSIVISYPAYAICTIEIEGLT